MKFELRHAAMPLGGALVGLTLYEPDSGEFAYIAGGGRLDVLLFSDLTASVVAAVVAVLLSSFVSRGGTAVGTVVTGAALVSVPQLFPELIGLYFNGTGAGLILGGLLVLCRAEVGGWLQSALATGVVLGSLDMVSTVPRRYADYTPVGDDLGSIAGWVLLAATVGLTLGFLRVELDPAARTGRALIVGVVAPSVALLAHWWFVRSSSVENHPGVTWQAFIAALVVGAAVIGGALWLTGSSGLVLIVGLSIAAVDPRPVFITDRLWVVVSVLMAGVGLWAGKRWPRPVLGIGLLAVVAVLGVADEVLAVLSLPAVAAFALAASLPTVEPAAAPAFLAPALLAMPYISDPGWTNYTSETGWVAYAPSQFGLAAAGVAGIVTIAVCASVAWVLKRRGSETIESG